MAALEVVAGLIADLLDAGIHSAARKLGYSEVDRKRIGSRIFWVLFGTFIGFLFYITFKYG